MMESQIESMRGTVAALKNKKAKREREKKRDSHGSPFRTSSSRSNNKVLKGIAGRKKKKIAVADDVLSFEQKKDLSITIQKLDGEKLEKVISIIHEGVPEIRDVSRVTGNFGRYVIPCYRVRRKLNWTLIHYPPRFSQSCTISFYDHYETIIRSEVELDWERVQVA